MQKSEGSQRGLRLLILTESKSLQDLKARKKTTTYGYLKYVSFFTRVSKPRDNQTDPTEIFISSITVINIDLLHQEQVVHACHSCLSIYLEVYQRHPAPFSSSEQYHISKMIKNKKKKQ